MVAPLIDLKCPHCDRTIHIYPRPVEWNFILGDTHRLLLCKECVFQIIGTVGISTVKEAIERAIKVSKWSK